MCYRIWEWFNDLTIILHTASFPCSISQTYWQLSAFIYGGGLGNYWQSKLFAISYCLNAQYVWLKELIVKRVKAVSNIIAIIVVYCIHCMQDTLAWIHCHNIYLYYRDVVSDLMVWTLSYKQPPSPPPSVRHIDNCRLHLSLILVFMGRSG